MIKDLIESCHLFLKVRMINTTLLSSHRESVCLLEDILTICKYEEVLLVPIVNLHNLHSDSECIMGRKVGEVLNDGCIFSKSFETTEESNASTIGDKISLDGREGRPSFSGIKVV